MNKKISFVSVNIERHKHIDRVRRFLRRRNPDVACLQEVPRGDFVSLRKERGMHGIFAPMAKGPFFAGDDSTDVVGVAILSRFPISNRRSEYYWGSKERIVPFSKKNLKNISHPLLVGEVKHGGARFVIGTTHFTWTPDGKANDLQRRNIKKLLGALKNFPEIILCGDFNAPRGGEIFSELAKRYTDTIPLRYDTSLDPNLHRAGAIKRMVDGLFITPAYRVGGVKLVRSISDHCAVVAWIASA